MAGTLRVFLNVVAGSKLFDDPEHGCVGKLKIGYDGFYTYRVSCLSYVLKHSQSPV